MTDRISEMPAAGRGQGFGCLGLALFSLLGTALLVVLGVKCLQKHDLFDCIGLLTIFPAAFAAIGLASAAIGLQRFTSAGRRQGLADRLSGLESGWSPAALPHRKEQPAAGQADRVIHLPGPQNPSEDNQPKAGEDNHS